MTRTELVFVFGGGLLAQALLVLRAYWSRDTAVKLLLCAFFAVLTGMMAMRETLDPYVAAFVAFVGFSFAFAMMFTREHLAEVGEEALIVLSVLFWYVFFNVPAPVTWKLAAGMLAFVPTLGTLWLAFTDHDVGTWERAFFYCWYLATIVAVAAFQFSFDHLGFFFDPASPHAPGGADAFVGGMAFLYLASHASHLVAMIPIPPRRSQSFAARLDEVREHGRTLAKKFEGEQITPAGVTAVALGVGAPLGLNLALDQVSPHLAVNGVLVILAAFMTWRAHAV
jgi:hypothetical protein